MDLTPRQLENFWKKVDRKGDNECWLWLGGTDRRGYGLISFNNRMYRAPRVSIFLATGAMPCPEHDACHCCDTPGCVNPNHLSACSRKQNMQDASHRRRLRSWKQKLSEQQVREIRQAKGRLKDIAAQHNIDPSTVSKIRSRTIWTNLP